jgi:hypothetical protein
MHSAALHRGLLARLRLMGSFELWAWIGLAITVAVVVTSGIDSDNFVPIFTFGASSIAARLAVVLEYARCDDERDEPRWRRPSPRVRRPGA